MLFLFKAKYNLQMGLSISEKEKRNYRITNSSELIDVKAGFSFQYKIKVVSSVRL